MAVFDIFAQIFIAFFVTVGIIVVIDGIAVLLIVLGFTTYSKYKSKKMPDPFISFNENNINLGFKIKLKGRT